MSGPCLFDSANIRSALFEIVGRHPREGERIDFKLLRQFLSRQCGLTRFEYVLNYDPGRSRCQLKNYLLRCGWRIKELKRSKFGFDRKDATDDYILNDIHSQITPAGLKTASIAVASHDGGFASALELHRQAGGQVTILGFRNRMSHKLLDLGNLPGVCLLDLAFSLENHSQTPLPAIQVQRDARRRLTQQTLSP